MSIAAIAGVVAAGGSLLNAYGQYKSAKASEKAANANIALTQQQKAQLTRQKQLALRDNANQHDAMQSSVRASISSSGLTGATGDLLELEALTFERADIENILADFEGRMMGLDSQEAAFRQQRSDARGPGKWYSIAGSLLSGGASAYSIGTSGGK